VDEPDATTDRIRVFVVDDHAVVRRGMRSFFATLEDIEVVGEAVDGKAALDELAVAAGGGLLPDVVLMDLVMPRLDGVSAIAAIKSAYPAVEVVAMTSFSEAERVHAALSAGASAFLHKGSWPGSVLAAVRATAGARAAEGTRPKTSAGDQE
jgi:DNA-binding NarL/FixJ family response regulator